MDINTKDIKLYEIYFEDKNFTKIKVEELPIIKRLCRHIIYKQRDGYRRILNIDLMFYHNWSRYLESKDISNIILNWLKLDKNKYKKISFFAIAYDPEILTHDFSHLIKQIEENKVSWHAGDGTDWGETTVLQDTGVKFTEYRPKVTISDDGYFVINGQKTTVASPRKEDGTVETRTNKLGILAVKGANGNYFIPTTWISSGYSEPVCIRGGNINGIGIESAVNTGSDVYFTWQRLAKLVAELLVKHDLLPDRVTFHNNFSNKTCPNTMITNNLVDMFLEMVYTEYAVAKNYADYKIEFISNNPDIIDNTGRVVNAPESTTMVSYTIKLTKGSDVEEVTLHSVIPGTKTLHK